jgi:RNA exonuclease NGL2
MILHREEKFTKVGERVVHFDEENVRFDTNGGIGEDVEAETRRLRGSSRKTKNIGLLVALKSKVDPKLNCIVVTCHLFWHPA